MDRRKAVGGVTIEVLLAPAGYVHTWEWHRQPRRWKRLSAPKRHRRKASCKRQSRLFALYRGHLIGPSRRVPSWLILPDHENKARGHSPEYI